MAGTTGTGDEIKGDADNTLSTAPASIIPKQEVENMEVHHHAGHYGKKNWKVYIWEFLMLFLAVFCGFLAEYQLEHKIEHDREKQYIISMAEDLEADTMNLRLSIESFNGQDIYFDTVFNNFRNLSAGYSHSLHNGLKAIIGYRDFFPTDKTMQQLKNSGGMRLIRNKASADSITLYDSRIKRYDNGMQVLDREFEKMYNLYLEIMDEADLEYDKKTMTTGELEKGKKNYLLKTDKAILGQYHNQLQSYRHLRRITLLRMEGMKENASQLILQLKKEYHLE